MTKKCVILFCMIREQGRKAVKRMEEVNYAEYRYALLYGNEGGRKGTPDLSEPLGAVLWRRRTELGYALCHAARLIGMTAEDLVRLEMGWAVPEKKKMDGVLAAISLIYGFSPAEYFTLIRMADEYRKEKPVDLSGYLGIGLNEPAFALMPRQMRKQQAERFVRRPVKVELRPCGPGVSLPKAVTMPDGRVAAVERITGAQEQARFVTGGVGTRYSVWIEGEACSIGYETPGEWFIEAAQN